jgi:hypothetical protein
VNITVADTLAGAMAAAYRERQSHLDQARRMRGLRPPRNARHATRTGHYYAAKYMRDRGWTFEAALQVLIGPRALERYAMLNEAA